MNVTRTIVIALLVIPIFLTLYLHFSIAYGESQVEISILPGAADIAKISKSPQASSPYDQSPITVKVGTTIKWINKDTSPHTATSGDPSHGPSGKFDSGIIDPGKTSLPVTFNETGTVTYFDTLNPEMTGIINVNKTITQEKKSTGDNIDINLSNISRGLKGLG
jgi:plastocyanin